MNKILFLIIITSISFNLKGQESFEGFIKFSIEISTTNDAPEGLHQKITDKYGDSLIMYYSKTGNFRRSFLNSAASGSDSQFYVAKTGKLYFTKNDNSKIDTLDARQNSINLIRERKIKNEKIINLDCECYELKARSRRNQNITLNYCYSLESPEIDADLFSNHNDFYLNKFYNKTKRPYLKFSLETDAFKLTYLATELIEMELDKETFEIK